MDEDNMFIEAGIERVGFFLQWRGMRDIRIKDNIITAYSEKEKNDVTILVHVDCYGKTCDYKELVVPLQETDYYVYYFLFNIQGDDTFFAKMSEIKKYDFINLSDSAWKRFKINKKEKI